MNENDEMFDEDELLNGGGKHENGDVDMEDQSVGDEEDDSSREAPAQKPRQPRAKRPKRDTSSNESSDDDDNDQAEESFSAPPLSNSDKLINVGPEYQATILPATGSREDEPDRDQSIWEMPKDINQSMLSDYICEATGRYRLPIDRALYILQQNDYNFHVAINQASKRKNLRDRWSDHEISVFSTSYFHFGKRFRKIRAVMPHRPVSAIVQFYYDSKKSQCYKTMLGVKLNLNEPDLYDEVMVEATKSSRTIAGTCSNCEEKFAVLIFNHGMKRHECKACVLYFRLMRTPRPASLRVSAERARKHTVCPEYMKQYVLDYQALMEPADGKVVERLGIGSVAEEDDDECMIIDDCPLRKPSAPYRPELAEGDDPVDSNTCRMTRHFEDDGVQDTVNSYKKEISLSIPLIWREKQTKCMEDIELLNEEARRTNIEIAETVRNINPNSIKSWRSEMNALRERIERMPADKPVVVASSSRSGRVRHDQNWSDLEKMNAVKCFHWYKNDFEKVSELLGTKTVDQVRMFHDKNREVIDKSIEAYRDKIKTSLANLAARK